MEHVIDGNLSLPKNSCFLALPMYWPVRNFKRLVFCESIIVGLDQNSLERSLSISRFIVHLLMLGNRCASSFKLFSRSCLVMYVARHLIGPLSGRRAGPDQESFW